MITHNKTFMVEATDYAFIAGLGYPAGTAVSYRCLGGIARPYAHGVDIVSGR